MAAQRVAEILSGTDIDLASTDEMRELLQRIVESVAEGASQSDQPFRGTACFNNKHVGKPIVWDGETEEDFKTWSGKFAVCMANAGDKSWRKNLKVLQAREGDEYLMDDLRDVEALLQDLNINPDLAEELSEILYDQLRSTPKESFCQIYK